MITEKFRVKVPITTHPYLMDSREAGAFAGGLVCGNVKDSCKPLYSTALALSIYEPTQDFPMDVTISMILKPSTL